MAFTTLKYSPMQRRLMTLLPASGEALSSEELAQQYYGRRRRPEYARATIVSMMRGLVVKVKRNREDFIIVKSSRCGPYPINFRKEKQK